MKHKMFLLSLLPILIFSDLLMWNDIKWLRFVVIYWQIISWVAVGIILNSDAKRRVKE